MTRFIPLYVTMNLVITIFLLHSENSQADSDLYHCHIFEHWITIMNGMLNRAWCEPGSYGLTYLFLRLSTFTIRTINPRAPPQHRMEPQPA